MANSSHGHGVKPKPLIQSKTQPDPKYDLDTFACGDLGFGFCLKPGGIPMRQFNPDTLLYEDDLPEESLMSNLFLLSHEHEHASEESLSKLRSSSTPCLSSTRNRVAEEGLRWRNIPILDGVPMGTSMRQQRELYAAKMKDYLQRKEMLSSAINETDEYYPRNRAPDMAMLSADGIQIKLQSATEEVEVLQCELEACKRQLDSKYRAIQILKSQSMLVNATQKKFVETTAVMKKSLEKEVNSLQFELDTKMSSLMLSEQTWAERFDRMCMENAALMATLQARSDELRKMHTDKMAIVRERDELIARMDVKERLDYDRDSMSPKDNSVNNESIAQQLSMLGACACRGSQPEPCMCARVASKLKKVNHQLAGEVERLSQELAAAQLSADSFRLAFEDQLDHNSTISLHVEQDIKNKRKSRRHRLPWRRRKLNNNDEEDGLQNTCDEEDNGEADDEDSIDHIESDCKDEGHDVRSIGVQASQPKPDLVKTLIELLNDRSQALAHQRLVAKMLARRTQDLEQTLARFTRISGSHEV